MWTRWPNVSDATPYPAMKEPAPRDGDGVRRRHHRARGSSPRHTLQHARELLRVISVELVLDVVVKLFQRSLLRPSAATRVS